MCGCTAFIKRLLSVKFGVAVCFRQCFYGACDCNKFNKQNLDKILIWGKEKNLYVKLKVFCFICFSNHLLRRKRNIKRGLYYPSCKMTNGIDSKDTKDDLTTHAKWIAYIKSTL